LKNKSYWCIKEIGFIEGNAIQIPHFVRNDSGGHEVVGRLDRVLCARSSLPFIAPVRVISIENLCSKFEERNLKITTRYLR